MKDQEYKKISITLFFLFAAVVIYVYFYSYGAFIKKKDLINEQYISYSESETYGRVAAVLKNEGDRLLVMPNDPLIYWVADMDTPTRTYEHYGWIYNIPEYQQEMNKILTSSPPEYIVDVGLSPQFGMENKVIDLLKNRYIRLSHVGKQSKFYVLRERYSGITSNQWESLHRMLFTELGK